LFLNLKAFPKVDTVISSELDAEWRAKVSEACGPDKRLTLLDKDPELLVFPFIDLVFIDNGPEQHKVDTIRWMAEQNKSSIVVVHDAEVPNYRKEIDKFELRFVFDEYEPGTAICTNLRMGLEYVTSLCVIERTIQQNKHLAVDDVNSWIEVMNG
jgi:hypothetical protein